MTEPEAVGALERAMAALERGATRVLRGGADPDAAWRPIRLFIVWLVTRLVVVVLVPLAPYVVNDVNYYATVITGQADYTFPGTLREYPVPALWLLKIPGVLGGNEITPYGQWFVFLMLLVDGLLLVAFARLGTPRAVTAWLTAGLAVGPLLLLRFDLVTGGAVAVALLVVAARSRLAAVLMVVAAGVKLWPAVLVGIVGAAARRRTAYVVATAVTSVVLVLASAATHGWDRLLTPLTYQTGRGLQVESLVAFPSMVLWALHVDGFEVTYPASMSFEVSGPGAAAAGLVSTLAVGAALVWTLAVTAGLWRRRGSTDLVPAAAWAVLSSVSLLVLANKVFSPQYLAWLAPIAIAVLAAAGGRAARTCAWLTILAALAAQVLYPWMYDWVTDVQPGVLNLVAVVVIGVRLVLVALVAWIATRQALAAVRAPLPAASPAAV